MSNSTTIDFTNDEEFDAWLDRECGSEKLASTAEQKPAEPQPETPEKHTARLEAEAETLRAVFNEEPSADNSRALDAKQTELDDLRQRVTREACIKEEYCRRYAKGFGTDADFERLWKSRLRDEAMIEDASRKIDVEKAMRHSVYRETWG